MTGYTLKDYMNDIKDQMIDVKYPYVLFFIGSMQLGLFDPKVITKQVSELVKVIHQFSKNTMVVFSGLVPRPMDHFRSHLRCRNYSKLYEDAAQDLRKKGYNCVAVMVFDEFLDSNGNIVNAGANFKEDIFLTITGIGILRAAWL